MCSAVSRPDATDTVSALLHPDRPEEGVRRVELVGTDEGRMGEGPRDGGHSSARWGACGGRAWCGSRRGRVEALERRDHGGLGQVEVQREGHPCLGLGAVCVGGGRRVRIS